MALVQWVFPGAATLWSNTKTIVLLEPFIFLSLVCYLLFWGGVRVGRIRCGAFIALGIDRLLLTGSIAIFLQMAITIKHFAIHYLIPTIVFSMMLNAVLVVLLAHAERTSFLRVLLAGISLAMVMSLVTTGEHLIAWSKRSRQYRNDVSMILAYRLGLQNCRVIPSYRSSSTDFALAFGNHFAGNLYSDELESIYQGMMYYNVWTGEFSIDNTMKDAEARVLITSEVAAHKCVLIPGEPERLGSIPGFGVTPLVVAGNEGLFQIAIDSPTPLNLK